MRKFVESSSTMVGDTLDATRRTQKKWSRTVQIPGMWENPKTISRNCRTFKVHQRLKRHFSHIPSRTEPIEEKEGESRTASCANASLPRVRESRWQQQTGADGRSVRTRSRRHRADKRVGKTTKKRATPQREPKSVAQQRVKATVDTTWQFSPLCQQR